MNMYECVSQTTHLVQSAFTSLSLLITALKPNFTRPLVLTYLRRHGGNKLWIVSYKLHIYASVFQGLLGHQDTCLQRC